MFSLLFQIMFHAYFTRRSQIKRENLQVTYYIRQFEGMYGRYWFRTSGLFGVNEALSL